MGTSLDYVSSQPLIAPVYPTTALLSLSVTPAPTIGSPYLCRPLRRPVCLYRVCHGVGGVPGSGQWAGQRCISVAHPAVVRPPSQARTSSTRPAGAALSTVRTPHRPYTTTPLHRPLLVAVRRITHAAVAGAGAGGETQLAVGHAASATFAEEDGAMVGWWWTTRRYGYVGTTCRKQSKHCEPPYPQPHHTTTLRLTHQPHHLPRLPPLPPVHRHHCSPHTRQERPLQASGPPTAASLAAAGRAAARAARAGQAVAVVSRRMRWTRSGWRTMR